MQSTPQIQADYANLKPKWQERFAFFDQHGGPREASYKAAFRALPFRKKLLINNNFLGFFFGPIYWFVLGMWKKNLVMLAIIMGIGLLEGVYEAATGNAVPRALDQGISVAFAVLYGMLTNYAYYLKQTKGEQGWNPFQGHRFI
ncbi:membrane protein [Pseudomonas putida]|jgi:hypothetical protein|uniref:Membrane protein n=1 Tax=Pseudomonas putida TaxID=303 RepID=A0A379KRT9_PSEPU|nr:DUF2628 domain-containing protein [Pseudomonas putida]QPN46972.1 DUF2628 domain-containing protein [Priestia aryabhattai]SUD70696.1 membrane protein [Pseudomonas putida]